MPNGYKDLKEEEYMLIRDFFYLALNGSLPPLETPETVIHDELFGSFLAEEPDITIEFTAKSSKANTNKEKEN